MNGGDRHGPLRRAQGGVTVRRHGSGPGARAARAPGRPPIVATALPAALMAALAVVCTAVPLPAAAAPAPTSGSTAPPPTATPPAPPAAPRAAAPLDLSGRDTLIGAPAAGEEPLPRVDLVGEATSAQSRDAAARAERLAADANAAIDRYNAARVAVAAADRRLSAASRALTEAEEQQRRAEARMNAYAGALYRGQVFDSTLMLLRGLETDGGREALHALGIAEAAGVTQAGAVQLREQAAAEVRRARAAYAAAAAAQRRRTDEAAQRLALARERLGAARRVLDAERGAAGVDLFARTGQYAAPTVSLTRRGGPAVAPLRARSRLDAVVSGLDAATAERVAAAFPGSAVVVTARVGLAGGDAGVVGVDPGRVRALAPEGAAESDALWQAVARGDAVVSHSVAAGSGGAVTLGRTLPLGAGRPGLAVGALATTGWPGADLVVRADVVRRFDAVRYAVLVTVAGADGPPVPTGTLRRLAGAGARIQLTTPLSPAAEDFLPGDAAAAAFGTFTYRPLAGGAVVVDPGWVAANIVTAEVPILGTVRCHRLAVPQLRGALTEVQARGLADKIRVNEYGGCWVPRFIGHAEGNGLSLHTWGTALDLNVPGNQRGTAGELDREVVAVFQRWGFRWGGDWRYTDPMHFELGALLRPDARPSAGS